MNIDKIRTLLTPHLFKTYLTGSDTFKELSVILENHPTWKDKIDIITGIRIKRSRLNKSIELQIKTITPRWFKISWHKCAQRCRAPRIQKLSDAEKQLTSAMRHAIAYQSKRWRLSIHSCDRFCVVCKSTSLLQVDHKAPSFHDIKQAFLLTKDKSWIPTTFGFHRSSCASVFLKPDAYFKRVWQQYHAEHATFQFLCKSCNCRKSNRCP